MQNRIQKINFYCRLPFIRILNKTTHKYAFIDLKIDTR